MPPEPPVNMKRVLLVTYDFPPVGGSGVQRIAKFAKYLPRFGWHPTVLTTRHGRLGPSDPTLARELMDIEVSRTLAPDPFRWIDAVARAVGLRRSNHPTSLQGDRLRPWHPGAWLIPDGKVAWIPFGVSWALQRGPPERCDIVLSTLPTPTAAILGTLIADIWGVPHVMDYRDPWSGAFYTPARPPLFERAEARLERAVVSKATAVAVAPGADVTLPALDIPVRVIHNGFDESDFDHVLPKRPNGGFVIAHVGTLWKGRDLTPLIGALDLLHESQPGLAGHIHLLQVGRLDHHVAQQFTQLGARFQVTVIPSVSHPDAIAYMLGADLLYLPTTHGLVPGKTYEYLRSGTPTLALAAKGSHLQSLLAETGGGELIDGRDLNDIAHFIEKCMRQSDHPSPTVPAALARYSRLAAADRLAKLLNEAVAPAIT